MAKVAINTGEKFAAYLGKCVICKRTHRHDVPAELRISNPHIYPAGMPWCPCRAGIVCQDAWHVAMMGEGHDHPATAINWKPLKATYVESKRCNAACEDSHSAVCRCSCGGRNHGRAHALNAAHVI